MVNSILDSCSYMHLATRGWGSPMSIRSIPGLADMPRSDEPHVARRTSVASTIEHLGGYFRSRCIMVVESDNLLVLNSHAQSRQFYGFDVKWADGLQQPSAPASIHVALVCKEWSRELEGVDTKSSRLMRLRWVISLWCLALKVNLLGYHRVLFAHHVFSTVHRNHFTFSHLYTRFSSSGY